MQPFVPRIPPTRQRLTTTLAVPLTPTAIAAGQAVEEALANLQSSVNAALVSPPGGSGNIIVLGADGVSVADSGVSFGTDPDQIPNAAQISGMISEEIINAPTLPTVSAATTANMAALSGTAAMDGVALAAGVFVLVKSQTAQHLNGVYQVAAGAWTRCYYNGSAWVPITAAQTKFDDLNIDNGIIQVNGGTINGSVSYRCAVSDTSKLLGDATVSVIFSKTTLAPVADACNRHVSINNGNDTNNNGTLAFPYQTIGKALAGMQFPGAIKLAPSGGLYSEAPSIPATATNLCIESSQNASRGGIVRCSGQWSIAYAAAGNTYHTYRNITWATASVNPFVPTGGGGALSIWMENCAFIGGMTDVVPTPTGFTGTLTLRNIDLTSAPAASVVIRANGGTYNFTDQTSPLILSLASGVTGAGTTINIAASCNPGAVMVPLSFAGTVNRSHPAPLNVVSWITSQASLDTLLANTSAASSGFYLLSGFTPTQNAALAGGVIGHFATGSACANWWERAYADLPSLVSNAAGIAYAKGANNVWSLPSLVRGVLTSAPTGATPAGVYVQIAGTPSPGTSLNDLVWWSGTTATLYIAFAYAPAAIVTGNATWSQAGGTWVPDGGITVQGVLTAAPVAGTAAGLYATNVAFGPVAAGDLVYLPGGVAAGTKYLSYANAPAVIAAGDTALMKVGGAWQVMQSTGGATSPYVEAWLSAAYNIGVSGNFTKIVFNQVNADTTNSYSTSTGTFTAPISGLYEISCALTTGAINSAVSLAIYKNGILKKTILVRMYPDWNNPHISTPIKLSAGDTIGIYATNNSSSTVAAISQESATWLAIAYLHS